jgi:hypothetical protein
MTTIPPGVRLVGRRSRPFVEPEPATDEELAVRAERTGSSDPLAGEIRARASS